MFKFQQERLDLSFLEVNCVCLRLGGVLLIEHVNLSLESSVSYTTTARKWFKELEMIS